MGRARVEPDIKDVVDFLPVGRIVVGRKKARGRADLIPGSAPSRSNASAMRALTCASLRTSTVPSGRSRMNTAIGTPQARWREITQSGRFAIMPVMRFSPCGGTQRVVLMAASARWRSVSPCRTCPPSAITGPWR
jgi:hypothetical protein